MEFYPGAGDISALSVRGTIQLYINGTKAQCHTELAALQKMLQAAVDSAGTSQGAALYSGLNQTVYLNYRSDNTETYYRSELLRAAYRLDPYSIEVLNFNCGGVIVYVDFERRNWWEGAESQLHLTTHMLTHSSDSQRYTIRILAIPAIPLHLLLPQRKSQIAIISWLSILQETQYIFQAVRAMMELTRL